MELQILIKACLNSEISWEASSKSRSSEQGHSSTMYTMVKEDIFGTTNLASARYLGTLDMLSMPPATTTSLMPSWMLCAASIVAVKNERQISLWQVLHSLARNKANQNLRRVPFIPDAQTLLTVVQTTEFGTPAPNAACLAGACPKFALRTLPKKTSCTDDGSTLALFRAASVSTK